MEAHISESVVQAQWIFADIEQTSAYVADG